MNLNSFLHHHRWKQGENLEITHTSLYPGGKYSISTDDKKQFYQVYNNSLNNGERLSMVELQTASTIPIVVDVDLNIDVNEDEHESNLSCLYKDNHVENLCEAFIHVLKKTLDPVPDEEALACFVFERDGYLVSKSSTTLYKNGFHLHFPKIILSRSNIRKFIVPKVIEYMREMNHDIPNMVDYESLMDSGIYHKKGKPWFLYGSTKPEPISLQPYLITHVYFEKDGELCKDKNWKKYLEDYETSYISYENSIESRLPEIFSLQSEEKPDCYFYEINQDAVYIDYDEEIQDFSSEPMIMSSKSFDTNKDYDFFTKLVELLPKDYHEDYDKWMQIGWITFNYYDGSDNGFEIWNHFSKKSSQKYSYEKCLTSWNSMSRQNNEVGMGTLRYIVRNDNPEEYRKLTSEYTNSMMESILHNTTHFDLAKILYHEYQDLFVCSSIKHNDWYQFIDHIWVKNDNGIFLTKLISTFLVSKYENLMFKYMKNAKNSVKNSIKNIEDAIKTEEKHLDSLQQKINNPMFEKKTTETQISITESNIEKFYEKLQSLKEEEKGNGTEKSQKKKSPDELNIERCQKIIYNLKTSPFKRNIMSEAKELFYDHTFESKLNSNVAKIAFKNGIYDLENKLFRQGLPTDYMSLKMDVNYRNDFSLESPEVKEAQLFFKKIFPNEDIRNYFLAIQSEIFWGRNTRKLFQMWIGIGNNGKSITQEVFERLLGPYCTILPTSLLTQKRTSSSSASPELVRAGQGARLCFIQEPSKTDKFNVGLLKELTGNDKFYARPLHRDPIDITPMFKLICIANHAPLIENSQNDRAVWNRVKIIPFESRFVKNDAEVPLSVEEQYEKKIFHGDPNFSDKIDSILEGVAYLLLSIYNSGQNKNITEPELVSLFTNNFKNDCDSIGKFISMEIDLSHEANGCTIDIKKFYTRYRAFLKENLPQLKVPDLYEVQEYMVTNYGSSSTENNQWQNMKFKNETSTF